MSNKIIYAIVGLLLIKNVKTKPTEDKSKSRQIVQSPAVKKKVGKIRTTLGKQPIKLSDIDIKPIKPIESIKPIKPIEPIKLIKPIKLIHLWSQPNLGLIGLIGLTDSS